jgi:xylose dehydrogenase (NAD/NADP)
MYRHHPQTRKLKEVVQSGAIGELRQVRAAFSFTLDDPNNVRLRPELDGGSLLDLGCYCVGISRLLAGEPELVFGRQRLGPTGIDLGFTGVLQFAGDVFGEFHCGFDLPAASGVEAIGSAGSVVAREPFRCLGYLEVNGERVEVGGSDRYLLQLENFSAAIRGEAEPLLGRSDALGQARAIEALYRSAESGEAVAY